MADDELRAKLLLVDDQHANLTALKAILDPLGHTLVAARSGRDALRHLLNEEADDFALILLDVQMPDMDGFETARLIKEREKSRFIPLLFITALSDHEAFLAEAYSAGAVDFIRKPFNPEVLRSKVDVFVNLFRQREQIRRQADLLRVSEQREAALRNEIREREREQRFVAELAEREAELRQFKTTLDATLDGVLLFDPERLRYTYANHGALHQLGYTADEMGMLTPPDLLPEFDRERFRKMLTPLMKGKTASVTLETYHRRKDGTTVPIEMFLQFVTPPEKDLPGQFVCLARDITERRRAEAEKASLTREVETLARRQRAILGEVLSSLTEGRMRLCDGEGDLPTPLPPIGEPVVLVRSTLRMLRRQVMTHAEASGWSLERGQDFETAVGEAAMNAVVHGKNALGRVHADPLTGTAQVWIRDEGEGISEASLHRATLERGYTTAGTLGHGFWMMLRTADRVWLLTGPQGTTVVLEQDRHVPEPVWLREHREFGGMVKDVEIAASESGAWLRLPGNA